MNVIFDMETSDPDDVCTLMFLCSHPSVNLVAVTVTPGTGDQISLVKGYLDKVGEPIPVGSRNPSHDKDCVSGFLRKWSSWLNIKPRMHDGLGFEVMDRALKDYPDAVLLTGAPLWNPHELLSHTNATISHWVGQGGFAGDSVVPEQHRLEKFKGKETCPTFNFNGDTKGALMMLQTDRIAKRTLVSKNVCHGVVYDKQLHEQMLAHCYNAPPSANLDRFQDMVSMMSLYLEDHPGGKMFHDPLAAAVMIDPSVCCFEEVEMYRSKGEWGSKLAKGTNTFISVSVDKDKFYEVLKGRQA